MYYKNVHFLPEIVQYDSDERRVISAMWAKDEDISRFLRYGNLML